MHDATEYANVTIEVKIDVWEAHVKMMDAAKALMFTMSWASDRDITLAIGVLKARLDDYVALTQETPAC